MRCCGCNPKAVQRVCTAPAASSGTSMLPASDSHASCNCLQAKPQMTKSTVVDNETGKSVDSTVRTSTGTFFGRGQDEVIQHLEKKIALVSSTARKPSQALARLCNMSCACSFPNLLCRQSSLSCINAFDNATVTPRTCSSLKPISEKAQYQLPWRIDTTAVVHTAAVAMSHRSRTCLWRTAKACRYCTMSTGRSMRRITIFSTTNSMLSPQMAASGLRQCSCTCEPLQLHACPFEPGNLRTMSHF